MHLFCGKLSCYVQGAGASFYAFEIFVVKGCSGSILCKGISQTSVAIHRGVDKALLEPPMGYCQIGNAIYF